jgi:hypothetical protein
MIKLHEYTGPDTWDLQAALFGTIDQKPNLFVSKKGSLIQIRVILESISPMWENNRCQIRFKISDYNSCFDDRYLTGTYVPSQGVGYLKLSRKQNQTLKGKL